MNYIIEGIRSRRSAAMEHQFTAQPEVHVVRATAAEAFRHELWNATTNAEYITVTNAALKIRRT